MKWFDTKYSTRFNMSAPHRVQAWPDRKAKSVGNLTVPCLGEDTRAPRELEENFGHGVSVFRGLWAETIFPQVG